MKANWRRCFALLMLALVTACADTLKVPPLRHPDNPFRTYETPDLTGYVYRPAGTGPFPAVVLLHGGAGLQLDTPQQNTWRTLDAAAGRYVKQGYVALILDSFTPRGLRDLSELGSDAVVPQLQRAWDAAAAADALVRSGLASKDRIIIDSRSTGASLHAAGASAIAPRGVFAAAIAWYPVCEPHAFALGLALPVLVLAGGADTWGPVDRCERIKAEQKDADRMVIRVYPGATHNFDYMRSQVFLHPAGHQLAYDPAATARGWEEIETFLRAQLR